MKHGGAHRRQVTGHRRLVGKERVSMTPRRCEDGGKRSKRFNQPQTAALSRIGAERQEKRRQVVGAAAFARRLR
jgi:hypothetical protein